MSKYNAETIAHLKELPTYERVRSVLLNEVDQYDEILKLGIPENGLHLSQESATRIITDIRDMVKDLVGVLDMLQE